ncbi:hypothetical protein HBI59_072750 [Parastagonospora nodorum]|nr:hypothetical protein HBI59_072750 [Parastagonospora nodorum]
MQRETRTRLRCTLRLKDFRYKLIFKQAVQNELDYKAILFYSKALATKHRASSKSLLFLALAYLKDLGVLVILSSEELLALVILSILRRIIVDNYATALLRA